nr:GNAT family N-acetyltransferase [Thetidibacter halocola]
MIGDAVAARDWKPRLHTAAQDIAHAGQMIERGWVTVAEIDDAVVGFLAREGGFVHALFVSDDAQGRGVGAALLAAAKDEAMDLTLWTFQANLGARRFYAREGFVEIARGDGRGNDERLPDVQLYWTRAGAKAKEAAHG